MKSNRPKVSIGIDANIVFNASAVSLYDLHDYDLVKVNFVNQTLMLCFDFISWGDSEDAANSLSFDNGEASLINRRICQVVLPFLNREVKRVEQYVGCKALVKKHNYANNGDRLRLYSFMRKIVTVQSDK